MSDLPFPSFDYAAFDAEAVQVAMRLHDSLGRTMCIARTLLEHGRTVDLVGLDRGVGLLCAKALDLPPELGRGLRPHLIALLDEVDRLTEVVARRNAA